MRWPEAPLGELFEITRGGSPRPINDYLTDDADGLNWVSISDATESGKYIRATKRKIKPSGASWSRMVEPGDFLLTNSMSFGRPYIMATSGCIHDGWLSLRPKAKRVDPDYLFRVLESPQTYRKFERLASGATVKNLNIDLVRSVEIPLPPLDEQRRIAAILDQADALRRMRGSTLEKLRKLPQVTLGEEKSAAANHSWPIKRLIEVAESLDRFRRPVKASDRAHGVIPYYGANGQQGWIDRALFNESLVLVAEDGGHFNEPERGVAYRIDGPSWVNNHAHILRPRDGIITVGFLHLSLKNYDFSRYISGSTRSKLTLGQLERAEIVCPPMPVQRQIDAKVDQIVEQQKLAQDQGAHLDALFASLQHRAFTGQLTRSGERLLETALPR